MGLAELKSKRLERQMRDTGAASVPPPSTMDRAVQKPLMSRQLLLSVTAAVLLIAAAIFGVSHFSRQRAYVEWRLLSVAAVENGTFYDYIPVTGIVQAETSVYLDVAQGGQVAERLVEEGASVTAGQPLVRLRNTALELQVTSQQAQVAQSLFQLSSVGLQMQDARLQHKRDLAVIDAEIAGSEHRLSRLRPLAQDGYARRADIEDEETTLAQYRHERDSVVEAHEQDERTRRDQTRQLTDALEQLERNHKLALHTLDDLTVKAPIDGQLTMLDAEIGASKGPGQRIGQIDREGAFKISAPVDEFYLGRIVPNQTAGADIDGKTWRLNVSKVHPEVKNRQFSVDMIFLDPPPASIRRGQSLQVRLDIGSPTHGLVVTNGSWFSDSGGQWVFVVSADGHHADKRTAMMGRHNPQMVEILSGLAAGDRIVTSGVAEFRDLDILDISQGQSR